MTVLSDFRNTIAGEILNVFPEIKLLAIYKEQSNSISDFEPGVKFIPEFKEYKNVVSIRKDYTEEDKRLGDISPGDVKFVILAKTLSATPTAEGKLEVKGQIWKIKKVKAMPLDFPVTYECQCKLEKA
jgi:hypothetical protein